MSKSDRNRNIKLQRAQGSERISKEFANKTKDFNHKQNNQGKYGIDKEVNQEQSFIKDFVFGNDDSLFINAIENDKTRSYIKQNYLKQMNKPMSKEDDQSL